MIGYMTLYFKIQCDTKIAYSKASFDFSICPTEESLEPLKSSMSDYYKELTGCEKAEAEFCSEEEYESNEQREIANYLWGKEEQTNMCKDCKHLRAKCLRKENRND